MSMAISWLLFPLVMLGLSVGCGLLVERAAGRVLPGVLLPSVGLAVLIVVTELLTDRRATAGLATPAVIVVSVAGYLVGWARLRRLRLDPWSVGVGLVVFAAFAAPVVLSGNATFLGYFFLNDTAWHLALVDQLLDRGRDVSGLPSGSFAGIVKPYLLNQYPVGTQLAAGAVRPLVGQDLAWVLQPYVAVLLSLVAVALHHMLAPAVRSGVLRALVAVIAAQAGLVYAYYAQSSIKELGTLWVLVVLSALVVAVLERPLGLRRVIPVVVVVAAGLDVLNLAVAPWIGIPLAVFAVGFVLQERGRPVWHWALALAGAVVGGVALASPALRNSGRFVEVAQQVLQSKGDVGNLVDPLQGWQIFGIWPAGDFRFPPYNHQPLVFVLIGVALSGTVLGLLWLLRRRPPAIVLLVASSVVAYVYLVRTGSPYANAKTMMIASGAVLLTAMLGAVAFREAGRRIESWALALTVAAGVLWTNGLTYHDANMAPRGRLAEMRSLSDRFAGRGPAWLDEWDELAAHFMRPVNVSNMPTLPPPTTSGVPPRNYALAKYPIDVNEVQPEWLQGFRLIVLRRSPFASLPPANFRPVAVGRYYEVWQRVGPARAGVLAHVGLGQPQQPNRVQAPAPASCPVLRSTAARAAAMGSRLAYVERPTLPVLVPPTAPRPQAWSQTFGDRTTIDLQGPAGTLRGTVTVQAAGRYRLWAAGSFDRPLTFRVAGKRVGEVGHNLGAQGDFTLVGTVDVPAGAVPLTVHRPGDSLEPGDGGQSRALGPVVLSPVDDPPRVRYIDPAGVRQLCGKRLDWVEIVR